MRAVLLYLIACSAAALAPWVTPAADVAPASAAFPGWPSHWEGRALTSLPIPERERLVLDRLPGRVACFDDGTRKLVLRWLSAPSADLHPARRCFRGQGYDVRLLPARLDAAGRQWGCFEASRDGEVVRVSERIHDERGRSWPDVSAWYWGQILAPDPGPWWAVLLVEPVDRGPGSG